MKAFLASLDPWIRGGEEKQKQTSLSQNRERLRKRRDVKLKSCHTLVSVNVRLRFYFHDNDGHPFGSPIRQEYPLNLSILLSGGKETNKDSLSKGD